jgi:hypothetical protein
MKTVEKVFLGLFIATLLLKILQIPGGAMFLAIFGNILQVGYLIGCWYLFAINDTITEKKYNNIVFSIIVGMCLSCNIYAITATILHWINTEIILPMTIISLIAIFPFSIYKWLDKNTENKTYYQMIMMRGLLFTVLSIFAYFV